MHPGFSILEKVTFQDQEKKQKSLSFPEGRGMVEGWEKQIMPRKQEKEVEDREADFPTSTPRENIPWEIPLNPEGTIVLFEHCVTLWGNLCADTFFGITWVKWKPLWCKCWGKWEGWGFLICPTLGGEEKFVDFEHFCPGLGRIHKLVVNLRALSLIPNSALSP